VPWLSADAAYNVLGGMPNSASENWFAVAPLKILKPKRRSSLLFNPRNAPVEPDRPLPGAKRDWKDSSPRNRPGSGAGSRFYCLPQESHSKDWREFEECRRRCTCDCGVKSRSELKHHAYLARDMAQLDEQFLAWKALEHA